MKKIRWGLVGGGRGSQIGPSHRFGASVDGLFSFVAGALDINPDEAKMFGKELGLQEERSYNDWKEMLNNEIKRKDKVELVTIATPNSTHFEIAKAFLQEDFHVFCEKPMTMTIEQGEELVRIAKKSKKICAVNYGYSGFSLVREMKNMIAEGQIGSIRIVMAEFAHGHHADSLDSENMRIRWRYNPDLAGISAVMADCGIHALHMACFVTGQEVTEVSADFVSTISSRQLEDDALVNFRMDGGATGRLWTSAVAVGRQHGLALQVFGEKGGLRWSQEQPNQLYFMPLGGRMQIIERGDDSLSEMAKKASRFTIGHSEGMPLAFANIYVDIAKEINRGKGMNTVEAKPLYPDAEAGLRSVAAVHAAKKSSLSNSSWVSAVPPILI